MRDERIEIPFKAKKRAGRTDVMVKSDYPYTEVSFVASDGELLLFASQRFCSGFAADVPGHIWI